MFEDTSRLCMFGVKDFQIGKHLKRLVRFLTKSREILGEIARTCNNKHERGLVKSLTNRYPSSSHWHTRVWAQALIRGIEKDASPRFEGFPAEDVDVSEPLLVTPGTLRHLPDDEFQTEPVTEEALILAVTRMQKNVEHPSKELLCHVFFDLAEPIGTH